MSKEREELERILASWLSRNDSYFNDRNEVSPNIKLIEELMNWHSRHKGEKPFWCNNFFWSISTNEWVFVDGKREILAVDWKVCPVCRAERPKE